MKRWARLITGFWLTAAVAAMAQDDLRLSDRDLEHFEGDSVTPDANEGTLGESRWIEREAVAERYDELIDRLNQEVRQLRNAIREVPPAIEDLRRRLRLLESGEEALRREDFMSIWASYPHLRFEDFDRAIEQALDRHERRESIRDEIRLKQTQLAALEAEREEAMRDLNKALQLREQEMDATR
jgi:predicted nuclease with TOPRIM domain